MRTARKNRKKLYYALPGESVAQVNEDGDEIGDPYIQYSKPVSFYAVVSSNKGSTYVQPFGQNLDYSKTLLVAGQLPIREGARIWLDTEPPEDVNDGTTADYRVVAISDNLNLTKYAVKRITKDGS